MKQRPLADPDCCKAPGSTFAVNVCEEIPAVNFMNPARSHLTQTANRQSSSISQLAQGQETTEEENDKITAVCPSTDIDLDFSLCFIILL